MLKAMLKKEFVVVGGPFFGCVIFLAMIVFEHVHDARRMHHPQGEWMLNGDFVYPFLLISLFLAISMGLLQSLSEDVQGTWRYILSFPGGWRRILKLKFVCGLVVWLVWTLCVTVICLVGMAVELGPVGEPLSRLFNPTMRILVCVPVVYLGAFLTAIRRVNWFFSRLMPLGGVLMCWFMLFYLPNWWIVAPLVTTGFAALLVVLVFHVAASRDFA